MPLNPDEIEAIRRATFPRSWGWRGYDRAEVEGFLERIAARLEEQDTRERELEKELVRAKARRRRAPAARRTATGAEPARAGRRPAQATRARRQRSSRTQTRRPKRRIDINRATFSQVREVGLGTTVAARLIALRDIRGGFRDLEEIRDVEGLSEKAFDRAKTYFFVDGEPPSR